MAHRRRARRRRVIGRPVVHLLTKRKEILLLAAHCCCWYLTLPVAYTCTKTVIKNKSEIMSKQKRIRSIKIIRAEQPKANKQITNLASIAEKVPSRTSDGGGGRRCHYYVSTSYVLLVLINTDQTI